ncbi:MAG: hypothetical protein HRU12_23635 [Phaeodactylibacter sp.]|nr:hypothetical protein [Phaeodactylibacter sp.]
MGVVEVAIIGTVLSTVGQVVQARQAKKAGAKRQAFLERQAEEQREARNIDLAAQKNQQAIDRRKAVRERRVKIAQIQQAAENTGAGGSSGETASAGIITTNLGGVVSNAASRTKAIEGINAANQRAADAGVAAQGVSSQSTFATLAVAAGSLSGSFSDAGVFKNPVPPTPTPSVNSGAPGFRKGQ